MSACVVFLDKGLEKRNVGMAVYVANDKISGNVIIAVDLCSDSDDKHSRWSPHLCYVFHVASKQEPCVFDSEPIMESSLNSIFLF